MDNIPFQNLTLGQNKQKEELLEVTDSLVPPPIASAMAYGNSEDTDGGLTEQELRLQREEEDYHRIHVSLISEEEESDMEMDKSTDTYFS